MSGGHFDYSQHFINDIADKIEETITDNYTLLYEGSSKESTYMRYSENTINEFKKAVKILRKAYIYAHRIDWLLSGDDGEETFHKRLKEELKKC